MRTTSLLALAAAAGSPALGQYATPKKLVSSEALQKLITLDDLLAGSQKLMDFANEHGGNRAFGGGGHNATVDWLYDELKKTGYYHVEKQPFVELFTAADVELSVNGEEAEAAYMTYGPSGTLEGAPVVQVNDIGCTAGDYPAEVEGKVALVKRGTCPFGEKAALSKAAGAIGTIIYNNEAGALAGTLGGTGDYAPTVAISKDSGESIIAALASGEVLIDMMVDTVEENRTNYNVIAETIEGDHDNVLVLGGHSDSVYAGPGINDDGSGTIGVLTVAKALTQFSVKNAVRFAFWGAEEFGKLGSFHYLRTLNGTISGNSTEVSKMRAYLNFDMIASPNYVLGVYDGDGSAFNFSGPAGSDTIERDFELFYESKGQAHVPSLFTMRSDYAAFLENGIPSGGLFTGAEEAKTEEEAQLFGGTAGLALDENYHQAGDDMDNLNHKAYLLNTQSIANSVGMYAVEFKGIPASNATLRKRSADLVRYAAPRLDNAHVGHKHGHAVACGSVPRVSV